MRAHLSRSTEPFQRQQGRTRGTKELSRKPSGVSIFTKLSKPSCSVATSRRLRPSSLLLIGQSRVSLSRRRMSRRTSLASIRYLKSTRLNLEILQASKARVLEPRPNLSGSGWSRCYIRPGKSPRMNSEAIILS